MFVALGVICFASLGVALSHAIPNFDSAPAYVNAAFLPLIFISGVFYDADNAPGFLRAIAEVLPLKHLIDGLSGAMVTGEGLVGHAPALLVLALWSAAGLVLGGARVLLGRAAATASRLTPTSSTQVPAPEQSIGSGEPSRQADARAA